MRRKLNTYNITISEDRHFHSTRYKSGARKDGNEARPKSIRETIKSNCSMSSVPSNLWQIVNSVGLGWLCFYSTSDCCNTHGFFFRPDFLTSCSIPQTINASPSFWGLHYTFGFTLIASQIALLETHCLASHTFFGNLGGSIADSQLYLLLAMWCPSVMPCHANWSESAMHRNPYKGWAKSTFPLLTLSVVYFVSSMR